VAELIKQLEELFVSYLKLNTRRFSVFTLSDWKNYHFSYPDSSLIGESEDGIGIYGVKVGCGQKVISLIAGCHADEPVGPLHLNILLKFLEDFKDDSLIVEFLNAYQLWIVPDLNPDGALVNDKWWRKDYLVDSNLSSYLKNRKRELPGRDVEFGFPEMRPENKAVYNWWKSLSKGLGISDSQVVAHVSLHGMGFSAGPWFLLEKSWVDTKKLSLLKESLSKSVMEKSLVPHDMERNGEKGFYRLGRGFCSRPDSVSMKKHFEELGDYEMAEKFGLSSMELIREIFGDVFTCVSEMPLFVLPNVGKNIGSPDLASAFWKTRVSQWELELSLDSSDEVINDSAAALGIKAMPLELQLHFQARLVFEAINVAS
jgi:hypothetical protein